MNLVKWILTLTLTLVPALAAPQDVDEIDSDIPLELRPVNPRNKVFQGKYHETDSEGNRVAHYVFTEIVVYPPMVFKNKKEEEFYWRTVRDVKKTLPYAKMIAETIVETYEYIQTFPTKEEREAHLSRMEKDVFNQYKPVLKKFTKGQAKVLIKLVRRETSQSSFSILKAFLGSFRAAFWQGFGRLFGVNLQSDYRPDKNREDGIIERVATLVEQGML